MGDEELKVLGGETEGREGEVKEKGGRLVHFCVCRLMLPPG